jgi:CHAT domain-containing protein
MIAARRWYGQRGGRLEELPSTALELEWVNAAYQGAGERVAWLREDWATERNVRGNVAGRRVVHFATHGLVDQRWGNVFGCLALTPGREGEAEDDGMLTLGEIYGLPMGGCELVVLSACQTNLGPEQRGEGVQGLARGFLVAGARRVVASNWQVADEATAHLMAVFASYVGEDLEAGRAPDYAAALQKAKRWMRSQGRSGGQAAWREPFFWAPFVLIGPH